MKVTVKLFALLRAYLPPGASNHSAEMEVAEDATPASVMQGLNLPPGMTHLVLINGVYVTPDQRDKTPLKAGDVLAVWPPVAGGAGPAVDRAAPPGPGPVVFDREMSIGRKDFLRTLAEAAGPALAAVLSAPERDRSTPPGGPSPEEKAPEGSIPEGGPAPYSVSGDMVVIGAGARRVELRLADERPRRLGSVRLPALRVAFAFFGFTGDEVARFMARFDVHFRRGGG